VVLVSASTHGNALAAATRQRLDPDGSARWIAMVPAKVEYGLSIGAALTDVLHVSRGISRDMVQGPDMVVPPLILVTATLAEIVDDSEPLHTALAAAQREFRRSCLPGHVLVLVYTGPVGELFPTDDDVAGIADLPGADAILLVSDGTASGFRLRWDDLVSAASLQLEQIARHPELVEVIVRRAARSTGRCISLGLSRIDISLAGLQREACQELAHRLAKFLRSKLSTLESPNAVPAGSGLASIDNLISCHLRATGGRIGVAADLLGQVIGSLSHVDRSIRVRQFGLETRQAIESLLPRDPPPRLSLWQLILAFLKWLFDLLLRRRPASPAPTTTGYPQRPAELTHADLRRLQLVQWLNGSGMNERPRGADEPWEVRIGDHPAGMKWIEENLPAVEPLAERLVAEPLERWLSSGLDDGSLRRHLNQLCAQALRDNDFRAVLASPVAVALVERAVVAASPLYPAAGRSIHMLSLVPPDLPGNWIKILKQQAFAPTECSQSGHVILLAIAADLFDSHTAAGTQP
jgi:hypothetical protein